MTSLGSLPLKGRKPQMGTLKSPISINSMHRMVTRQSAAMSELGFDEEDKKENEGAVGSLSSSDEEIEPRYQSEVRYSTLKKRLNKSLKEKDELLHKVSAFKDQVKILERQLSKEESDRKTQLNIMKKSHESAFIEKNRVISLLDSIMREQEAQIELLHKHKSAENGNIEEQLHNSPNCITISRLTTALNRSADEKNDLQALLFTQQNLTKELQREMKAMRRCETEKRELQTQIKSNKKTIENLTRECSQDKLLMKKQDIQLEQLKSEINEINPNNLPEQSAEKLQTHINKLQDKLLVKEAELAELHIKYEDETNALKQSSNNTNEILVKTLQDEINRLKSQPVQPKEGSIELASLRASYDKLQIDTTQTCHQLRKEHDQTCHQLRKEHDQTCHQLSTKHDQICHQLKTEHDQICHQLREENKILEGKLKLIQSELDHSQLTHQQLLSSCDELETFRTSLTQRNKTLSEVTEKLEIQTNKLTELEQTHQQQLNNLNNKLKEKTHELAKLRQEMINKVDEIEENKDREMNHLDKRYKEKMAGMITEYKTLNTKLILVQTSLAALKHDYLRVRELFKDLCQLVSVESSNNKKTLSRALAGISQHNVQLLTKYRREMSLRKKYHNELVELKGNIRVFCRVRPILNEDQSHPAHESVLSVDRDDQDLLIVENKNRQQTFDMDRLFMCNVQQQEVFNEVRSLVTSVIDGYHVCIFAYGQTGSGKTYTMEGPLTDPGINQRALNELFKETGDRSDWKYNIQVSVLEIYNEKLNDLLNSDSSEQLDIKMNQDGSGLHVPGLTWRSVSTVEDVNTAFKIGHSNRSTAATNMNEHSSRSHALLCVRVDGVNQTTGAQCNGKLNLVDLAGSERVSKSGADGLRLKEAQSINKSLSSLGDVISALRNRQTFIPYRNSKLTYLLQDSLGGDSKTLMIVQVAPNARHVSETICSLNFAQRVRSVELGVCSKRTGNETPEVQALKNRIAQLENSPSVTTPTKGTPKRKL